MEGLTPPPVVTSRRPAHIEAWDMVLSQLQAEMPRREYETWVEPLVVVGWQDGIFQLGAYNSYTRDWVMNRLQERINGLLEGMFQQPVRMQVAVLNSFYRPTDSDPQEPSPLSAVLPPVLSQKQEQASEEDASAGEQPPQPAQRKKKPVSAPETAENGEPSNRKVALQRAYGSERARLIQPERGMFLTLYLFNEWLPLLGHSAFTVILAARSLCYWNPMTGELRNVIETEMSELARRAAVSVRTVKDVLANDLVKRYFLRYRVRRMMTSNGVRTAGILLQVRMDEPLTPQDQEITGFSETDHWYTLDPGEDEGDETI
ncbi:MAG TPA: DnaA N-terminal domain-containing protein [Longilinea sp.]|nr:DnaA N-terminal domain-containing protein [Longilinea sp.]